MGIALHFWNMEKNILSFVYISDILSNNIILLISILFGVIIYFLSSFLFALNNSMKESESKKWQMI